MPSDSFTRQQLMERFTLLSLWLECMPQLRAVIFGRYHTVGSLIFSIDQPAGKPSDHRSCGKSYDEIYQIHILSPLVMLFDSRNLTFTEQNK
jgi:hypothetical protein